MAKDMTYTIDGYEVPFWAPEIQKNFPVGEDDRSLEDERKTNARVEYASTKDNFFRVNLDNKCGRWIKFLENGKDEWFHPLSPYLVESSYRNYITFSTPNISEVSGHLDPEERDLCDRVNAGTAHELTDQGRAELLAACKREQARLTKRLNTWWKRYGADYLHVWTYWTEA